MTELITPTPQQIHKYGWIPDLPDQRDFMYSAKYKTVAAVPTYIDLRLHDSPIQNQLSLGCCVEHALSGDVQMLQHIDKVPYATLSRLFIYYNTRVAIGTVGTDSGSSLRDAIKTMAAGACGASIENLWLYSDDGTKFKIKPPAKAYASGLQHVITSYMSLVTLDDMLTCLASGYPFVFGFSVYESFESDAVAANGIVPMPGSKEKLLGGHAVCCVGYNQIYQRFLCRNSWGVNWGIKGYFTIPYIYLTNPNLASDFWTIRRGSRW